MAAALQFRSRTGDRRVTSVTDRWELVELGTGRAIAAGDMLALTLHVLFAAQLVQLAGAPPGDAQKIIELRARHVPDAAALHGAVSPAGRKLLGAARRQFVPRRPRP
jgi:hypothetical protein